MELNNVPDLEALASGYLQSAGFRILDRSNGCIVADRIEFGGRDIRVVQTAQPNKAPDRRLLENIVDVRSNYPDARATILVPSREGFTRDYIADLSAEKVGVVVPVQFFDAPFKVEQASRTTSVIADIRRQAETEVRIPQPYELVGVDGGGTDLFDTLLEELTTPNGPKIRFVVGRAGVGKSYLFRALFRRLYGDFLDSKGRLRRHARPIPLLPEHLKGSNATRINHLIQTFLHDDVASPILPDTFSWLLTNGFATWLLDGLDELYAGEDDFFDDVFDLVADIESHAQITIWCRDSLLTSSASFADFLDTCADLDIVKVFNLTGWERQQKRLFAWQRAKKRTPNRREDDPEEVATFLTAIDKNPTLRSLSSLPFYCELIFERIPESGVPMVRDDVELLNSVIDEMVARERKKGLLDESYFEEDGLADWMEEIAVDYVEGQGYAETAQARELGEYVLQSDLDNERREDILRSLLQFPLFSPSEGTGRIAFAHELIAQALAARFYLKQIGRGRTSVFGRLTGIDFEDPVLLRFVASRFTTDMMTFILDQLRNGAVSDANYGAVLFLLLLVRPERDLITRENLQFAGKDLAGVPFVNRDLSGHRFVDCNLSRVSFRDCDLRGASFEGAFLSRTRFTGCNLGDARFGNINRIESISFGTTVIHDNAAIRERLFRETGMALEVLADPCPTALQVVRLLSKFVTPLGRARRDRLDEKGLLAGRRVAGAASLDACVRELVQFGYLSGPDFRQRYSRCSGDAYRDIVMAVKDGTLSEGIGAVVGRLCRRAGCLHQVH